MDNKGGLVKSFAESRSLLSVGQLGTGLGRPVERTTWNKQEHCALQFCGAGTFLGSGSGRPRSQSRLQAKKRRLRLLTLKFLILAVNNLIINKNHFWIIVSL